MLDGTRNIALEIAPEQLRTINVGVKLFVSSFAEEVQRLARLLAGHECEGKG